MENKKKIAILGAGLMAKEIITKAKVLGYITYVFSTDNGAVAKDLSDYFFPLSIFERDKIINICKQHSIDGVIAATGIAVTEVAAISNYLGLNSNSLTLMENIRNKNWVRNNTKDLRIIQHPNHCLVIKDGEDINLKFPVVVKPMIAGGKRGVNFVDVKNKLPEAIRIAIQEDKNKSSALVEEYIGSGSEYSVESLSFHGNHKIIQITKKINSGPPHFVELGHDQPAMITDEIKYKIDFGIKELLDSLGWENGPAHIELKIVNDILYLIEINPRFGGDFIASKLTPLSTGYDYIGEAIKVALNIAPDDFQDNINYKYSGIRFITKQTEYLLETFRNCDCEKWCVEKHVETNELQELIGNNSYHTNYFIYCDDFKPEFGE